MPKLVENNTRTEYENYEAYVDSQDSRYHDYDCPNCLENNMININSLWKRDIKFTKLLDVGCRDASYFDELIKENIRCNGIDISPRSVEYTRSKGRDVVLGDVNNLSSIYKNDKFDMIVSNHTLEHFLDPQKAINECYKVLANKGHMLIKLPNEGKYVKDTTNYAHVRTFNEQQLRTLLNKFKMVHFELILDTNEFFIIVQKVYDLSLKALPRDSWWDEYKKVMQDEYVGKKFDRPTRLKDKQEYVRKYLPELMEEGNGIVLDLGPGPGEFLEVCRTYGYDVLGIDAKMNDSEMGNAYMKLASLMTERQEIPVKYVGFENINISYRTEESVKVINSQGSIEQIFRDHLIGPPLREHLDCRKLSWNITEELRHTFTVTFEEFYRMLQPDGICMIYANGAKNTDEYNELLHEVIDSIKGLEIVEQYSNRHVKIKKL